MRRIAKEHAHQNNGFRDGACKRTRNEHEELSKRKQGVRRLTVLTGLTLPPAFPHKRL